MTGTGTVNGAEAGSSTDICMVTRSGLGSGSGRNSGRNSGIEFDLGSDFNFDLDSGIHMDLDSGLDNVNLHLNSVQNSSGSLRHVLPAEDSGSRKHNITL